MSAPSLLETDLGQGQGHSDQFQMMKNNCFILDVPRFLGLFEARPVIFTYHMTCYGYIFYRSSCILEDNSKTLDGFRGIVSF